LKSINKYLSPFAPFLLGLGCLALAQILSYFPEFTEEYYRNGLFAIFRWVRDGLFSLVPIPLMLVILLLGLFLLFRGLGAKKNFHATSVVENTPQHHRDALNMVLHLLGMELQRARAHGQAER